MTKGWQEKRNLMGTQDKQKEIHKIRTFIGVHMYRYGINASICSIFTSLIQLSRHAYILTQGTSPG